MAQESTCRVERLVESLERIRIPVPKNRLVRLTVLGGVLSMAVAVLLAYPGVVPGMAGAADGTAASAASMVGGAGGANQAAPATGATEAGAGGVAGDVSSVSNGLDMGEVSVAKSGELDIRIAGEFAPGNTVTVTVLREGSPVEGAVVVVDGHYVGRTDPAGRIDVIVREDGAEITAETEDATGTLDVDLEGV